MLMPNPDAQNTPSPEPAPADRARWSIREVLDYVDGIGTEYGRQLNQIDNNNVRLGLALGDGLHELAMEIHKLSRRVDELERRHGIRAQEDHA